MTCPSVEPRPQLLAVIICTLLKWETEETKPLMALIGQHASPARMTQKWKKSKHEMDLNGRNAFRFVSSLGAVWTDGAVLSQRGHGRCRMTVAASNRIRREGTAVRCFSTACGHWRQCEYELETTRKAGAWRLMWIFFLNVPNGFTRKTQSRGRV